ncbi:MAG: hypothetical protein MUC43_17950 [Pirellula sp.]|jgi:hypothetical protein|nr:hypothetical protein [Pirellula sp.]
MELQADELKVEFEKIGDRFSHKLLIERDGEWSVVLESIEGTDEERWPASPPLQQIVAEPIGKDGRTVLLGVGLSGTGHWSISVDENEAGGLLMDIACRVSGDHGFLGSSWRLGESWNISLLEKQDDRKRLVICSKDGGRSIEIASVHGDVDCSDVDSMKCNTAHSTESAKPNIHTYIMSKPTGRDLYPKPQRWAVRFKIVA